MVWSATLLVVKKKLTRIGKLEVLAFGGGFALMVFELAAARILAPSIGSSTYIWTSVIGVIIAALSLGYYAGGRIADSRKREVDLGWLHLFTAVAVVFVLVSYIPVIDWAVESFDDPRIQGVFASLVLFAPASFLLGALSPYLAKLNVTSLSSSGSAVASLSALNSVGGIVGTFLAGFVLFGLIGSRETMILVTVVLIALSWMTIPKQSWKARAAVTAGLLAIIALPVSTPGIAHFDTPSAHYSVYEGRLDNKTVRVISTGPNVAQSGVYPNQPDKLVFWYTQQIDQISDTLNTPDNILVLGGGTFTLPRHFAAKYPDATIDVAEIDPELVHIAREHFFYDDPKNVNIVNQDARTYVNQTDQRYDLVVVDVYGDTSVPFSFTTKEYGDQIRRITRPDGAVAVNMIAGTAGECGRLFNALDAPYRQHFANADYKVQQSDRPHSNIIVRYSNQSASWNDSEPLQMTTARLYTDNFSPTDQMQQNCRTQP